MPDPFPALIAWSKTPLGTQTGTVGAVIVQLHLGRAAGSQSPNHVEIVDYGCYRTNQSPAVRRPGGAVHEGHARFPAMRVFRPDGGCIARLQGPICTRQYI